MVLRTPNANKLCDDSDILIPINRILYVDKENAYPDVTRIHLDTGEILESTDPLNVLQFKLQVLKEEGK